MPRRVSSTPKYVSTLGAASQSGRSITVQKCTDGTDTSRYKCNIAPAGREPWRQTLTRYRDQNWDYPKRVPEALLGSRLHLYHYSRSTAQRSAAQGCFRATILQGCNPENRPNFDTCRIFYGHTNHILHVTVCSACTAVASELGGDRPSATWQAGRSVGNYCTGAFVHVPLAEKQRL